MSKILVYDIEANGLLEDSDTVHCIVGKGLDSPVICKFWDNEMVTHMETCDTQSNQYLNKGDLFQFFSSYDKIVCHNQLMYDIPMIKKFYDIDLMEMFGVDNIIDTFVWSQVMYPDRPMPKNCPTTIIPSKELKLKGFKSKKIGAHGLDSWGYRVNRHKPTIHDWSMFTPSILGRCIEDVLINEATLLMLAEEGGIVL